MIDEGWQWYWVCGSKQKYYIKTMFKKLKKKIKDDNIWLTPHALARIEERVPWGVREAMKDMKKWLSNVMYNMSHKKFYITWEKFRYVIAPDDFLLVTVSYKKYTLAIYWYYPIVK